MLERVSPAGREETSVGAAGVAFSQGPARQIRYPTGNYPVGGMRPALHPTAGPGRAELGALKHQCAEPVSQHVIDGAARLLSGLESDSQDVVARRPRPNGDLLTGEFDQRRTLEILDCRPIAHVVTVELAAFGCPTDVLNGRRTGTVPVDTGAGPKPRHQDEAPGDFAKRPGSRRVGTPGEQVLWRGEGGKAR